MLSREDNELLTLTGPGTAMGELLRRYWTPVVLASELAPGGRVKRVQLIGERLIAYRTPSGRPGLIAEFCPHRGASLYFGRVEETGMRCVYHGWKYGHDGRCVDMPSEPAESNFAAKVATPAYPCDRARRCGLRLHGAGGPPPPLPDLEWTLLPADHVFASKRVQDCNWFQAMEGGIDSSHISFLHAPLDHDNARHHRGHGPRELRRGRRRLRPVTARRASRWSIPTTACSSARAARSRTAAGTGASPSSCCRSTRCRPSGIGEKVVQSHIWVPMDDTHVINWMVTWHLERPLTREEIALHVEGKGAHVCDFAPATSEPYGDIRTAANRDNDYFMDWEAHRTRMFCGIPGFGVQDQAIQESQGPIVDRARGAPRARATRPSSRSAGDSWPRRVRCATAGRRRPAGTRAPSCVRSASIALAAGEDWVDAVKPLVLVRPEQTLTLA